MPVSEKLMKKVLENGVELWDFVDHVGYLYKGKNRKKPQIFICFTKPKIKEENSKLIAYTEEPVVCYTAEQFEEMAEEIMGLINKYEGILNKYEGMTENLTD